MPGRTCVQNTEYVYASSVNRRRSKVDKSVALAVSTQPLSIANEKGAEKQSSDKGRSTFNAHNAHGTYTCFGTYVIREGTYMIREGTYMQELGYGLTQAGTDYQ
eukprot:1152272-Pelagomonas_calceolata.AAC.21